MQNNSQIRRQSNSFFLDIANPNNFKQASAPCFYCFNSHIQSQLINNLCPNIHDFVENLREKTKQRTNLKCRKCEDGEIKNYVQNIIYEESEDQYLERIKQFDMTVREQWIRQQMKQEGACIKLFSKEVNGKNKNNKFEDDLKQGLHSHDFPRRKIGTVIIKEIGTKCHICKGKGFIEKIQLCGCERGCIKCNRTKVVESQTYKKQKIKIKLEGKPLNKIQQKCTICLQKFLSTQRPIQLECMHYFHKNCLEQWLHKSTKCPICRFEDTQLKQYSKYFPKNINFDDLIPYSEQSEQLIPNARRNRRNHPHYFEHEYQVDRRPVYRINIPPNVNARRPSVNNFEEQDENWTDVDF